METNNAQEPKFRDCHRCISIYFCFFYFDEKEANILKVLVVFVRAKIRFRFFTQFQTLQKNNNTSFYDSKYLESLASNDSCPF